MNIQSRRSFLMKLGGVVAGLALVPLKAFAWPKEAFNAEGMDTAMTSLYGDAVPEASDKITLKAPEIAENGAVVPISVSTDIPNVQNISILVEQNPSPLAASFELGPNSVADVSTRIKMGKTSNVIALVQADGKVYQATQEVKVTIGGCGG